MFPLGIEIDEGFLQDNPVRHDFDLHDCISNLIILMSIICFVSLNASAYGLVLSKVEVKNHGRIGRLCCLIIIITVYREEALTDPWPFSTAVSSALCGSNVGSSSSGDSPGSSSSVCSTAAPAKQDFLR